MTPEEKKARNRENQKRWRANNKEKVRAQKQRAYRRKNPVKLRPHSNEQEWQRLRKRFDIVLMSDTYLRENISRRMKCKPSEIPDKIVEVCRPLLEIKRTMKQLKKEEWILISREKPPANREILITDGIRVTSAVFRHTHFDTAYEEEMGKITHWNFLPRPPI